MLRKAGWAEFRLFRFGGKEHQIYIDEAYRLQVERTKQIDIISKIPAKNFANPEYLPRLFALHEESLALWKAKLEINKNKPLYIRTKQNPTEVPVGFGASLSRAQANAFFQPVRVIGHIRFSQPAERPAAVQRLVAIEQSSPSIQQAKRQRLE